MTRPRKNPGTSRIRTRDLPLSRRTPYHLANEAVLWMQKQNHRSYLAWTAPLPPTRSGSSWSSLLPCQWLDPLPGGGQESAIRTTLIQNRYSIGHSHVSSANSNLWVAGPITNMRLYRLPSYSHVSKWIHSGKHQTRMSSNIKEEWGLIIKYWGKKQTQSSSHTKTSAVFFQWMDTNMGRYSVKPIHGTHNWQGVLMVLANPSTSVWHKVDTSCPTHKNIRL